MGSLGVESEMKKEVFKGGIKKDRHANMAGRHGGDWV